MGCLAEGSRVTRAKRADIAGTRARVTLSDGSEVTLTPDGCDFRAAKAVHLNLVSLRKYLVSKVTCPAWLGPAVHGIAGVLQIGEDSRLLELDGEPTALGYDDELGVFKCPEWADSEQETFNDELDW